MLDTCSDTIQDMRLTRVQHMGILCPKILDLKSESMGGKSPFKTGFVLSLLIHTSNNHSNSLHVKGETRFEEIEGDWCI